VLECHTYLHRAESLLDSARQSVKLAVPRREDYFSALLALDMLDAALGTVGLALTATTGGVYRKVMGAALAVVLLGLAGALKLIERIRNCR
jgi:hypothetical protein